MESWSQKYLKLSPRGRRRQVQKNQKKQKRKYKKVQRRQGVKRYSREQMIEWGKRNGVRVVRDLWKMASIQEDTPTFKMVLKQFGSWGAYKEAIGLCEQRQGYIGQRTQEQYIRLCIRFNIQTAQDYKRIRKQYKGIIISYNKLLDKFGNWYNFKRLLRCFDVDRILTEYVQASIEAGHALKLSECDKLGIQIRRAMNSYGRKIFNALVRKKEEEIYKIIIKGQNHEN